MSVDLAVSNAKIITNNGILRRGLAVKDGKIYAICKSSALPKAQKNIDAEDKIILPGLIDVHTHLRDLQLAFKEDYYTGTCAALASGFTTVLDMPNTVPPTDSFLRLKEKMEVAKGKIVTNVGFYSGFPKRIEEVNDIAGLGAVGFKVYLNNPRQRLNVEDDEELLEAFMRAKKANRLVAIHAESRTIIEDLKEKLKIGENRRPEDYLKAHPPRAEAKAVKRIITLVKKARAQIHFCHISTRKALSSILKAKTEGLPITCEATTHHLLLSKEVMTRSGNTAIMDPPLRSQEDVQTLWRNLIGGGIDFVVSDHAPHTLKEKEDENVWNVPPGIPGLETTLPLFLTMVNEGRITMNRLVEVLAQKPARLFHLNSKGFLKKGFDADFTIVDLEEDFTIDPSHFYSKAKYSPFSGWRVSGKAIKVFVGGKLAIEDGQVLSKPGSGRIVRL